VRSDALGIWARRLCDDAVRFGQIDIANLGGKVLEFLRLIEPMLQGISSVAIGNNTVIHGDIGLGRKIPLYNMGDGIVRLLNIILSIATSQNGMVLIDEFGNGFHYSMLSRIVEAVAAAAKEFNVQVVATTHSEEFLSESRKGLAGKYEDRFAYIRLSKGTNGIAAKNYDYEMLSAALDQGWEVR